MPEKCPETASMKNVEVTPRLLAELVQYDPDSGKLFWKERHSGHFSSAAGAFLWNADNAGKEAGKKPNINGYKIISVKGQAIPAHRVAWAIYNGEWPPSDIDHINGVRFDNRMSNLRTVNDSQNQRNKVLGSNNTSGHVGVCKTANGRWSARILNTHIGTFSTLQEAVDARNKAQLDAPAFTERHGKPKIVSVGFDSYRHKIKIMRSARISAQKMGMEFPSI
jgi:hypothetical protein